MKQFLFTFILTFTLSFPAFAQTDRERGIELYKQKNYAEAVRVLEQAAKTNKKDAEIWNTLGLAYLNARDFKQSRKALSKAVKLNPQSSDYHTNLAFANLVSNKLKPAVQEIQKAIALNPQNAEAYYMKGNINLRQGKFEEAVSAADRAIKINPAFSSAYILKSDGYLYNFGEAVGKGARPVDKVELLKEAMETLETCLKHCEKSSGLQLQEALNAVKAFYSYFNRNIDEALPTAAQMLPPDPTVTPLKILSKPRANYTDSARTADIQGIVRVAVLFAAEGKPKYILVIKPLSNGLTEQAIKAARQIAFEPQLKDGKPVSVVKIVEYSFTLY